MRCADAVGERQLNGMWYTGTVYMRETHERRQLWLITGIVITGMVVGYGSSFLRGGEKVRASLECPATCNAADCPHKKAQLPS